MPQWGFHFRPFGSAQLSESEFRPGIGLMDPVAPLAFVRPPSMVDPGPPWPPRLVAEVLGTGAIPAELSAILAAHSWTFHYTIS